MSRLVFNPQLNMPYYRSGYDPLGYAYGAALAADGETLDPGYPDESRLFKTLRSNGTLPLVKEMMIRGWSTDNACAREAINGGLGTWVGSNRTRDAVNGRLTYGASSCGMFRQNFSAFTTTNSWGVIAEIIDPADYEAAPAFATLFGCYSSDTESLAVFNGADGNIYLQTGINVITITAAMPNDGGFLCVTRTSSTSAAVYYLTYAGVFSTLGTYTTANTATSAPTQPLATGAFNISGTPAEFAGTLERFVAITSGLSAGNAELIMTALNTYKTAKGWS